MRYASTTHCCVVMPPPEFLGLDGRQRDVDDRAVEERDERCEHRDREHELLIPVHVASTASTTAAIVPVPSRMRKWPTTRDLDVRRTLEPRSLGDVRVEPRVDRRDAGVDGAIARERPDDGVVGQERAQRAPDRVTRHDVTRRTGSRPRSAGRPARRDRRGEQLLADQPALAVRDQGDVAQVARAARRATSAADAGIGDHG